MRVHFTANARRNLRAAHDFMAQNSSRYAIATVHRVVRRAAGLATMPLLGSIVPEYEDNDVREVYEHPYRILYRVLTDQIDILAVIHHARQLPPSV